MKPLVINLICLLLCISCAQKESKPDKGKVTDNVYENEFFGVQVTIPIAWVVQNAEQIRDLTENSKSIVQHANPEMAAKVDSIQDKIIQMLTVFQYPVEDTSTFNPSFVMMAEKLPTKLLMDEKVYIKLTIEQLKRTGLYQSIDPNGKKINLGGRDFFTLSVTSTWKGEKDLTQDFYVSVMRGYAVVIITSYTARQQQDQLIDILRSLKFD